MPRSNETGIVKNAANFATMIIKLQSLGARYQPAGSRIALTNLIVKRDLINDLMSQLTVADRKMRTNKGIRKTVFAPCNIRSTELLNNLRSLGVPDYILEAAEAIQRKIQGTRADDIDDETETPPTENEGENNNGPRHISVSQRGFDNMVSHWERWVELLKDTPGYASNESHLTIAAIEAFVAEMKLANLNAETATAAENQIRGQRDNVMFYANDNILQLAAEVKSYIKIVVKAHEPVRKEIIGLKFR